MKTKKILIIGGTGFIGLNILRKIEASTYFDSYQIVLLSRSNKSLEFSNYDIIYVQGDYTCATTLRGLFKQHNFENVLHLASTTVPVNSNINIYNDVEVNLMSTIKLLEMMVEFNCLSIVFLSSGGALYGEGTNQPFKEMDSCKPISSYGIIKWTIERYLEIYQKKHNINYLILRISNVYGPYHYALHQGVINVAIKKALKGEIINVWGDGSQTKDYIYSEDLAEIIISLIQGKTANEILNIGSGESVSLKFIIFLIQRLIPSAKFHYQTNKISDIPNVYLNIDRLKALIPFSLHSINDGIYKTFEWTRKNLN